MLKSNYKYEDEYMYFTFKGVHSSKYNIVIQNDIEDLKLYVNSNISIDFTSPKNQNGQYVLGVSRPQRKIPLNIVAENLTRKDVIEIAKWLKSGSIGELGFDFSPDWVYDVILTTDKDINLYPIDDEYFTMSWELEFSTVNSSCARSKQKGWVQYEKDKSEIDETTTASRYIIQQTSINNFLGIPILQLNNPEDEDEEQDEEQYTSHTIMINHIGTLNTNINIKYNRLYNKDNTQEDDTQEDNAQEDNTQEDNAQEKDFSLLLYCNNENYLRLNGKIKTGDIIEYKGANNLVFKNNKIIQELDDTQVDYNIFSLNLKSPGAPILVKSRNELETLVNETPYSYFVCKSKKSVGTAFIPLNDAEHEYPLSTDCAIFYDLDTVDSIFDPDYDYYFGFCDEIKIEREDDFKWQLTIEAEQQTEVI